VSNDASYFLGKITGDFLMYVLKISYEIALSGGYGRQSLSIPDSMGDYFHQRGARVTHTHWVIPCFEAR
jgi:hypothetical protein